MMIDNNGKETGSKTDEEYLNKISSLIDESKANNPSLTIRKSATS